MADIWAPVIAALGAAFLTAVSTFGLEWWRSRRANDAALSERRSRAYSALLARSTSVMHLAADLHALMEVRSGLREGLNVMIGKSTPLDLLELLNRSSTVITPLYEAWSEIWAIGSKDAIAEANSLVTRCGDVVGTALQRGKAVPSWLTGLLGERWTKEQLDQWQLAMTELAESRRRFGMITRKETGVEIANLFTNNDM